MFLLPLAWFMGKLLCQAIPWPTGNCPAIPSTSGAAAFDQQNTADSAPWFAMPSTSHRELWILLLAAACDINVCSSASPDSAGQSACCVFVILFVFVIILLTYCRGQHATKAGLFLRSQSTMFHSTRCKLNWRNPSADAPWSVYLNSFPVAAPRWQPSDHWSVCNLCNCTWVARRLVSIRIEFTMPCRWVLIVVVFKSPK